MASTIAFLVLSDYVHTGRKEVMLSINSLSIWLDGFGSLVRPLHSQETGFSSLQLFFKRTTTTTYKHTHPCAHTHSNVQAIAGTQTTGPVTAAGGPPTPQPALTPTRRLTGGASSLPAAPPGGTVTGADRPPALLPTSRDTAGASPGGYRRSGCPPWGRSRPWPTQP